MSKYKTGCHWAFGLRSMRRSASWKSFKPHSVWALLLSKLFESREGFLDYFIAFFPSYVSVSVLYQSLYLQTVSHSKGMGSCTAGEKTPARDISSLISGKKNFLEHLQSYFAIIRNIKSSSLSFPHHTHLRPHTHTHTHT